MQDMKLYTLKANHHRKERNGHNRGTEGNFYTGKKNHGLMFYFKSTKQKGDEQHEYITCSVKFTFAKAKTRIAVAGTAGVFYKSQNLD